MNNLEDSYNQAVQLLKKGFSKEDVLLKFPEAKQQLAPLLDVSALLLLMPKNQAPTPLMRRKYAAEPAKHSPLAWLFAPKFAITTLSLSLMLAGASALAYGALKSTPGMPLFAIKKSAEQLQLVLATSQDAKANYQIKFAQNRLTEAKEVFSNPGSTEPQKQAALAELGQQTSNAITEVTTAAKTDPSETSHPLLNSLDSITKQQMALLNGIKQDSQSKILANSALETLNQNEAKVLAIKQSITVASSNQEVLATLNANPNSVAVFGSINQISSTQITVEKTLFNLNLQTVIRDTAGNNLNFDSLKSGTKANVVGIKNDDHLLAQQIIVTESPKVAETDQTLTKTDGSVAQASASATPAGIAVIKKISGSTTTTEQIDNSSDLGADAAATSSDTASGLFIFENPNPQFIK